MRAKPRHPDTGLMGPNDILGFRNRSIPNVVDIITIGDSQTYGNNAVLEKNWPNQMVSYLSDKAPVLYNMSVGGWGALEYMEIFYKSLVFHPRIVIVAFYTGNDPLETFIRVYGNERWAFLRPNPDINASDAPKVIFPPPKSDCRMIKFSDGTSTVFTPKLRHSSNQDHPTVHAGYNIMAQVARQIFQSASKSNIKIIFTIIPTKELVYARKIETQGIKPPNDYYSLVRDEKTNLLNFATDLKKISGAIYVDLLNPLQEAALKPIPLYPMGADGHPLSAGYKVIAKSLSYAVSSLIRDKYQGGILVRYDLKQKKLLRESNDILKLQQNSEID